MEEKFDERGTNPMVVKESNANTWLAFQTIFIHPIFFSMGLVVVSTELGEELVTQDSITVQGRVFSPFQSAPGLKLSASLKKVTELFAQLTNFSQVNHRTARPLSGSYNGLHNAKRREEIFLPLQLAEDSSANLFVYPWFSKAPKNFTFNGFSHFVSAGCMFGAALKGYTDYNEEISLIDHHLELRPNACIERVDYDVEAANPFEEVQLKEFAKSCLMMRAFSKEQPELKYHLPYYDYILFGLKLFVRNEMTKSAFEQFCKIILKKAELYSKKITQLCDLNNIKAKIESPFENLFKDLDLNNPAASLLEQLGVNEESLSEEEVVKSCLLRLKTNLINEEHREVWEDITSSPYEVPKDIEALLRLANAFMLAVVAKGKPNYEVCSLLPLSEKQIQLEYAKLQASLSGKYSLVFNLNQFEPVLTYSVTTKGLLFYLASQLPVLSSLISEQDILAKATRNIGFFNRASTSNPSEVDPLFSILSTTQKK